MHDGACAVMLSVNYAQCHLCSMSFMLSVVNKPSMVSVIMLNVVMLNVVMLSVIMLNAIMLCVVILSVVLLNVVAPI